MNKKLYAFAFSRHNISINILWNLNGIYHRYHIFNQQNIQTYANIITKNNPSYIIGLGMYTGRDKNHIRIETQCTNKFRNATVDSDTLQTAQIESFITPSDIDDEFFKLTTKMGNSVCNLTAWRITSAIKTHNLSSKFLFLHIPKSFNADLATNLINTLISKLRVAT